MVVLALIAVLSGGCKAKPAMAPQSAATIEESKTPEPVKKETAALTSQQIVDAFKAAGLPIGRVEIYDEENDPNSLLGRPGQYIAKFNWADKRLEQFEGDLVGGSIESFADDATLKSRSDYLKTISESAPMFAEYQFSNGLMLLRLSSDLTPKQAKAYEKTFMELGQ
jgi:hypothetical protein